uniref:Mechanosensitive ion channel MscS domain-containing protein n=1 Tax=Mucochytrium quahogii TaxID=96639 RepID=A0A7S2RDQ9_9STRA|mmetsp:Transcript_26128/g.42262  ORF Transcript_26128/g.42262 Transcript_26128/m.42262 type:complete len:667 (-) Transcript_26128:5912-7912(-)|eukprot:CAMPEP_0203762274 /NCGR_PEP_ID=MMETSP0098-20131031/15205_1 /ASSEMBLY_ACC=CAM_ASM_000208 /TAXON_ID=96639 /ORGANISM=" , Strain NY0313808BC1" /LENGTH=666 /DNA_ID=CAMNT_0050656629 /DNA_START=59 /DNA_END=2059 /DNA_ORIENTATION=-
MFDLEKGHQRALNGTQVGVLGEHGLVPKGSLEQAPEDGGSKIGEANGQESELECTQEDSSCSILTETASVCFKENIKLLTGLVIGVPLVICSLALERNGREMLLTVLTLVGAAFCLPLVSVFFVWAFSHVLQGILGYTKKRGHLAGLVSRLLYFLQGTSSALAVVVWGALEIVVFMLLIPASQRDDPQSTLGNFCDISAKLCTLVVLFFSGKVIVTCLRMWFSQHFNVRSFTSRFEDTLFNEQLLCSLYYGRSTPHLFQYLDREFQERIGNVSDTGQAAHDPLLWQQVAHYVNTHQIDGTGLPHCGMHAASTYSDRPTRKAKAASKVLFPWLLRVCDMTARACDEEGKIKSKRSKILCQTKFIHSPHEHSRKPKVKQIDKERFVELLKELNPIVDSTRAWKALAGSNAFTAIDKKQFEKSLIALFRDRRDLSISVQDSNAAAKGLDGFMMFVVVVICIIFVLGVFDLDFFKVWATMSSFLCALTFIFSGTVSSTFSNVFFLFVVHPYDVGDFIQIGDRKERYKVVRIFLTTTTLLRTDGTYVKLENSVIRNMGQLHNYSTSERHLTTQTVEVDLACIKPEFITNLKAAIHNFIEKQPAVFSGYYTVNVSEITRSFKCNLHVAIELCQANDDLQRTSTINTELIVQLAEILATNSATNEGKPVQFLN